ncbi:MAG TPA: AraC family transcriptional regulator [Haloplasmataceae bacterium]
MASKNELIKYYQKIKAYYHNQSFMHPSYELEMELIDNIKQGSIHRAKATLKRINALPRAILAKDKLRSIKNSLICSCTLFTRAIIEVGVNPEDAFGLSDACIQKIETIDQETQLDQFEYEMLEAFINLRLQKKQHHSNYSPEIDAAIQYIYNNIFNHLTLEDISQHVSLSPNYLSSKFKQEVGISMNDFINKAKVEESKFLLIHSNTKISDIAYIFNFCNQSYYTKVFKKYTGFTPYEYKKLTLPAQENEQAKP